MPHQCVRCNKFYDDGAKEILSGCPCGARLFFFIKQEKMDELRAREDKKLSPDQRIQMEQDIFAMLGVRSEEPVVLDFESVRVLEPGKYEIDVVSLFRGKPLIFKIEEGKYVIDLQETFQKLRSRR
ncbi:MAG: Zn-ribbon containing protein [Nanoarchaeota archaeon]